MKAFRGTKSKTPQPTEFQLLRPQVRIRARSAVRNNSDTCSEVRAAAPISLMTQPADALFRGFRGHDNQRAYVVSSLLIPFDVGGIAVRERLRPPAAAVHTFALDICEIET